MGDLAQNSGGQSVALPARSLPPLLTGNETPAVRQAVDNFYSALEEIFEAWVARRQSPHTQRAYRKDVLSFVDHMGWAWPKDAERFLMVSVRQVQGYRDHLAASYSPKTAVRRLCSLSSWYRFLSAAAAELRLPVNIPNPAHSQFIPRETADAQVPAPALTIGRVRQVLTAPEGDDLVAVRDRAILAAFFYTGARISAIVGLKAEDFFEDESGAELRVLEKGGRIRELGLNEAGARAITAYVAAAGIRSGPLFRPALAPRGRHELTERGFSDGSMRELVKRYLGLLEGGERYRPHSARATVATELLEAGTDPVKVQELLGHSDIRTTLGYDRRRRTKRDSASHGLPW